MTADLENDEGASGRCGIPPLGLVETEQRINI
jgi:hypothetical protein